MNKYKLIVLLLVIAVSGACGKRGNKSMQLKTGDILFCNYDSGELSSAIDAVTQTQKQTHYSHMGLVEITNTDTFVIHASLKRGVIKENLDSFFKNDNPAIVDVYRLSDEFSSAISEAIDKVQPLVGLPYNSHYQMNDSCYYCSQLLYKAFEASTVFTLDPMTFKDPGTDNFNAGWLKHYALLGLDIPEGEPGCNPNGMAASSNLRFVERLK